MGIGLRVEAAVLGRRRAGVEQQSLTFDLGDDAVLRDLISAVVRSEVAAFSQRQEENSFLRVLTDRALAAGVEAGAVRSGDIEMSPDVDVDAAIATALLAFEDGVFQVYVDGEPVDSLDQPVLVHEGTQLMFLRLVALAGG